MNDNTLETIKLLLKDSQKIQKDNRELSKQLVALQSENQKLTETLVNLEERLFELEQNQLSKSVAATSYATPSPSGEELERLLDLPLSRILDAYSELPQILETMCYPAAVSLNEEGDKPVLERNNQGNYWVIQLREQGFFLFPRPSSFMRIAALESMQKLFEIIGEMTSSGNYEFVLRQPAKLELLKRNRRWQLSENGKGLIQFGETPLEFQWQQEIRHMRDQYARFSKLLEEFGTSSLEATLLMHRRQQELEQRYGNVVSIIINTCMPMAYSIYKGPMLVPCNIIVASDKSLVVPAWDRGIPWETSVYAKFHSKVSKNMTRSRLNHPILPNQPYLKEINWENPHTWAIANSYEEASQIVSRLDGQWGSLEDKAN